MPDIAEHVFSKGQHELKTLNVFFLNQHLKIYHFTLFQNPVIEILRKRMVVIKREYGYIVLILIVLEAQILSGEH